MPLPELNKPKIRISRFLSATLKEKYETHKPLVHAALKQLRDMNYPKATVMLWDGGKKVRILFLIKLKSQMPDFKMYLCIYNKFGKTVAGVDFTAIQNKTPKCFQMGELI